MDRKIKIFLAFLFSGGMLTAGAALLRKCYRNKKEEDRYRNFE